MMVMKNAILLLLGCFLLKASYAESLVIDNAEMFSPAEEKQLLARIGEVHRNHNGVICLYTVPSLDGRDIFEYSMATANSLGWAPVGSTTEYCFSLPPVSGRLSYWWARAWNGRYRTLFAKRLLRP
jgi:uncharacterized membrane protein YgcG